MDPEEKDEFALEMDARWKAPLEWETTKKYKVRDLKEPLYAEALRLVKKHYFRAEPMCKASSLVLDQVSVNEYAATIRNWMRDTTSLVATSAATGRVVGVLIARMNSAPEKTDTWNRVQVYEGETLKRIEELKSALFKRARAHEKLGHEEYLCVYVLSVHPSYREKGVATSLLTCCERAAEMMRIPAIGGLFTSGEDQALASCLGLKILDEIRYALWVVDERAIFDDPGRGNYSAALMGKSLRDETTGENP